jgi:hypothetical protein
MHDSDIFQWMKPDAAAFRLTGFPASAGTSKEKSGRVRRRLNLSPRGRTHPTEEWRSICRLGAESDQDEIDQRNQGGADADGDQGIVGADVGPGIERCLLGFSGHFGGLGRAGRTVCELGHIRRIFFAASSSEQVDVIRVGKGKAGRFRPDRDRRWASKSGNGDRERARSCGCRCLSTPWRQFPVPSFAARRSARRC